MFRYDFPMIGRRCRPFFEVRLQLLSQRLNPPRSVTVTIMGVFPLFRD